MIIVVLLILSVLACVKNNSKIVTLLIFLFAWCLFGWNYSNGDYDTYKQIYSTYSSFSDIDDFYELSFKLSAVWANSFNLDFQSYLICISLIILTLWLRVVYKLSSNPAIFSLIFVIFFFPLDYVLLRNFLAFALVAQGLLAVFLDVKFKYAKFLFFVIIACSIHMSSFLYLGLIYAFNNKFYSIKTCLFYSLLVCVVFILLKPFIFLIINQNSSNRTEFYDSSITYFFLFSFYQVINAVFIKKIMSKVNLSTRVSNINLSCIIQNINNLLLFLIPLYLYWGITIRLFRNVAIINCLFLCNLLFSKKLKSVFTIGDYILFILYLLFFYFNFISPVYYDTVYSLYSFNLIFK